MKIKFCEFFSGNAGKRYEGAEVKHEIYFEWPYYNLQCTHLECALSENPYKIILVIFYRYVTLQVCFNREVTVNREVIIIPSGRHIRC